MISNPLETGEPFTALALNYYLPKFFDKLWAKAKVRICADGGANRVNNFFTGIKKSNFVTPDFVIGDLDSINREVLEKFSKKGTEFVRVREQEHNDIDKSFREIKRRNINHPIVVFGGFGGRMDQTIASLDASLRHPELRIFFVDDSNFSTWIRPNDKGIITQKKWTNNIVGLLPIAGRVRNVKTRGLKWDCNFPIEMGKFISSSNEISESANEVEIETTDPFLWTNQTKSFKKLIL